MKLSNVLDFLSNHKLSNDVLILGESPSSRNSDTFRKKFKEGKIQPHGTFARLEDWTVRLGLEEWDFHNVIPHIMNCKDIKQVDESALQKAVKGKKVIIALGHLVARVCKKYAIDNYKIDHPSPRNRNFNGEAGRIYEQKMLDELKKFLDVKLGRKV
tara:strand:- start:20531 stop:21001 length:471 start_codon:yes stop_codon:yes gene_type:complete